MLLNKNIIALVSHKPHCIGRQKQITIISQINKQFLRRLILDRVFSGKIWTQLLWLYNNLPVKELRASLVTSLVFSLEASMIACKSKYLLSTSKPKLRTQQRIWSPWRWTRNFPSLQVSVVITSHWVTGRHPYPTSKE